MLKCTIRLQEMDLVSHHRCVDRVLCDGYVCELGFVTALEYILDTFECIVNLGQPLGLVLQPSVAQPNQHWRVIHQQQLNKWSVWA